MNPSLSSSVLALFLLTTSLHQKALAGSLEAFDTPITLIEQQRIVYVAIARNDNERERGLMFQRDLGENQGMLFIYPDLARRSVWMKNTLLALDVVFLSGDGRIVARLENLQPCHRDPCRIYDSKVPARYMLELSAGYIEKHALKPGQQISLPEPLKPAR